MTYTIGQVSEMIGLPISTLRYYDKMGLFPHMKRVSGVRQFSDTEVDALRIIACLKKSGLEIKDIKQFMDWCVLGRDTYPQRKALFEKQIETVEAEIDRMNHVLALLKYKRWYYTQAILDGNEERLQTIQSKDIPEEIRAAFEELHPSV